MAGPINYSDLFEGLGPGAAEILDFTKNVKGLNSSYKTFAKNLDGDSQKIAAGLATVLAAINGTKTKFEDVNVVSRKSRTTLDELSGTIAKLAKEQQELKDQLAGVAKVQKDTEASTKGLNSALKQQQDALRKAFAAGDMEAAKAAAREILKLKGETDNLSRALRGANSDFTAAAGSFRAMENEARQLDMKLKGLAGGMDSNSAEAQQLKAQLADVNERMRVFTQETGRGYLNVGRYAESLREGVSALNTQRTELLANAAALRTQMQATGLSAEQQERLQNELKQTDAELAKNTASLRQYGVGVKSGSGLTAGLSNSMGGLVQSLTGAYYGIQGIATAMQQGFASNVKYSSELADVRKTTGLTGEAAELLADKLKSLDTPTTLSGLLQIAKVGGQLGYSSEQIFDFTRAIDTAVQALGDDFGGGVESAERIATELGKIASVFKKDLGPDKAQNLLAIGSALNQISADGSATTVFLSDVTQRVGQMASAYGVGLDNVLAMSAVLEESGASAERAGTSLNRLFSTIAGKTKASFEIAKLGDANLTLRQFTKLVNSDFNGAIQAFLRGLNSGGTSTTKVNRLLSTLKLESGEAKNTILALAQNTELFAQRQATANEQLREATSLSAEAAIKTDTLAAAWEKLKNNIVATVTNGTVGAFLKGTIEFFNGGILYSEKYTKTLTQTVNETVSAGKAAKQLATDGKSLFDTYQKLSSSASLTTDEQRKLQLTINELRKKFGDSVAPINQQTGAYELNAKAVQGLIEKNEQLANAQAITLAKQLSDLDKQKKAVEATTSALTKTTDAQAQQLSEIATPDQLKRIQRYLDLAREGSYLSKVGLPVQVTNEQVALVKDLEQGTAQLGKEGLKLETIDRDRAEVLRGLAAMHLTAEQALAFLAGTTKKATKTVDDSIEADKAKKKSVADVAAEEYKRRKQLLEFEADDLERQSKNPANNEEIRLRALRKERGVREEIAKLDLAEGIRQAAQSNKDKINGQKATETTSLLLTEKYKEDVRRLGVKLSKDEIALQNLTLDALSRADQANVEEQIRSAELVRDNINRTYEERQQAAQDVADYQIQLAQLTYDSEIRAAEGALDKIADAERKFEKAKAEAKRSVKFFDSDKAIDDIEKDFAAQQLALEKARSKGLVTEKEYHKQLETLDYQREYSVIAALEREYGVTEETLRRKRDLYNKYNEEVLKGEQEAFDKRMELIQMGLSFTEEVGNAIFQSKADSLSREQELNQKTYDSATKAAGENSLLKQQAEEQYFKKKNDLARKQFENDKKAALFQIALSTAMGVASVLSTGGPARYADAGIGAGILIAGVLASGVAQAAVVLSRQPPLPEYFKGREGGPAEFAWVAERGPELIEGKSGGSRLVEKKQITYLQEGDKVYTADKTRQLLANVPLLREPASAARQDIENTAAYTQKLQQQTQAYLSPFAQDAQAQARDTRMAQIIVNGVVEGTRKALHERPEYQVTEQGIFLFTKTSSGVTKHLNSRHKRNG
ncbi:phage tail tape measure protein [Hymenobacter sp. HSC-4F20]|uniref:phage tail tape measure protein n=1 Tax=Hymenobacter sp. HSC-4F20 TaxID=2864135 RepID=UPI001C72A566|nr:phage tail tape measure protein [Hymenobacter sp. HSC-4F20]MBX0293133.1 phage tail tape measure protein [Hymenobacter sp. HSC-4F20]